jgi:hypothetical protein
MVYRLMLLAPPVSKLEPHLNMQDSAFPLFPVRQMRMGIRSLSLDQNEGCPLPWNPRHGLLPSEAVTIYPKKTG